MHYRTASGGVYARSNRRNDSERRNGKHAGSSGGEKGRLCGKRRHECQLSVRSLYRQLQAEVPGVAFTASGGISSEAELEELDRMGVAAAILGKSLYTGALDLKCCAARVQR